jgi:hypothetical protein
MPVAWAVGWALLWVGLGLLGHNGPWATVGPLEQFILAIVQMVSSNSIQIQVWFDFHVKFS